MYIQENIQNKAWRGKENMERKNTDKRQEISKTQIRKP